MIDDEITKSELVKRFGELKIKRIWALYVLMIAIPILIGQLYPNNKFIIMLIAVNFLVSLLISTQLVIVNKKVTLLYEVIKNEKAK